MSTSFRRLSQYSLYEVEIDGRMFRLDKRPNRPQEVRRQGKLIDLHVQPLHVTIGALALAVEFLQIYSQPSQLEILRRVPVIVDLIDSWRVRVRETSMLVQSADKNKINQTCKLRKVIADIESLVVVCGVLVIDERDLISIGTVNDIPKQKIVVAEHGRAVELC